MGSRSRQQEHGRCLQGHRSCHSPRSVDGNGKCRSAPAIPPSWRIRQQSIRPTGHRELKTRNPPGHRQQNWREVSGNSLESQCSSQHGWCSWAYGPSTIRWLRLRWRNAAGSSQPWISTQLRLSEGCESQFWRRWWMSRPTCPHGSRSGLLRG